MQGGMSENPQLQGVYILYLYLHIAIYIYYFFFFFDICTLAYVLSLGWTFAVAVTKVQCGILEPKMYVYNVFLGVTCILGNRSRVPLIPSHHNSIHDEKFLIHSRKFLTLGFKIKTTGHCCMIPVYM